MGNLDLGVQLQAAIMFFVPFLFALCFHEFAHAWMAKKRGDRTAEMLGRLTMNPMAHADLFGTIILPLMALITHLPLFGWAKPVPVNPRNLAKPKDDMFWIALAGPMSNVLLALVGTAGMFILLRTIPLGGSSASTGNVIFEMGTRFIAVNVLLAVFNMIPLHPLDGGKVLARFLPEGINRQLEDIQPYTGFVLMAVFVMGGFRYLATPVQHITVALLRIAGVSIG